MHSLNHIPEFPVLVVRLILCHLLLLGHRFRLLCAAFLAILLDLINLWIGTGVASVIWRDNCTVVESLGPDIILKEPASQINANDLAVPDSWRHFFSRDQRSCLVRYRSTRLWVVQVLGE